MNYTIKQFAEELKEKAENKVELSQIGKWAFSIYDDNIRDIDEYFEHILKRLDLLQEGYEFELSHKMLLKIANDLLAGKKVDMTSHEYREFD